MGSPFTMLALVLVNAGLATAQFLTGDSISPKYLWFYQYPLPIPSTAQPKYSTTVNGNSMDYYEIEIKNFTKQIYPNLGPAHGTGFDGSMPGPTFRIKRGTETVVRYLNHGVSSSSTHLHGSWTRSPWDGWADDVVPVGSFKDYYYPNTQSARTLWYHDHADHHTGADAYYGQDGIYILYDDNEDQIGYPGGNYDVPLLLTDPAFQNNGDFVDPSSQTNNWYGDTISVNGQPWPYLSVEPRKYRFRILDAALSRPFELFIADSSNRQQTMTIIASDGGYFQNPVQTQKLVISMGERYEVIIDFSPFAGQNITMGNSLKVVGVDDYENTDKVMRFVVGNSVSDSSNNNLPGSVNVDLPPTPPNRDTVDHVFNFQRTSNKWTINGVDFDEPEARVLARPPQGTVENWQLRYASGPGVHPVHVHLVDFQVVSRSGGTRGVEAYESAGMKDVVLLNPGEVVNIVAWYGPWNGQYMFHCHNLVHEDNEMMDVFNATYLEELGYNDWAQFDDPMDTRWAPTASAPQYFDAQSITATLLPSLASLNAYRAQDSVTSELAAYYSTHPYGETSQAFATRAPDTTSGFTSSTRSSFTAGESITSPSLPQTTAVGGSGGGGVSIGAGVGGISLGVGVGGRKSRRRLAEEAGPEITTPPSAVPKSV